MIVSQFHRKRTAIGSRSSHCCSAHFFLLFFHRFPNIACELLTSDVSLINDKLGGDESLLEILYHFLEQDPPLNPLLASFFSKTIGNLIARKTEQVPEEEECGSGRVEGAQWTADKTDASRRPLFSS